MCVLPILAGVFVSLRASDCVATIQVVGGGGIFVEGSHKVRTEFC